MDDAIDLQELAVRIIRYLKNHLAFIIISSIIGIGLGVGAYKALPNTYSSKMIVLSDLLSKTYGQQIDESLNNLISENNFEELSSKLGLEKEKVTSITSIHVESITEIKSTQRELMKRDETFFSITVTLTDRTALPDLQEGLVLFMRNNDFVKTRVRQREELGNALIARIDKELRSIDSMKSLLFQSQPFKGEKIMFDPERLLTAGIELTELKWNSKHDVELASGIHLVEGFTIFQKPKNPKLMTLIIAGFMLGFISGIGLLTFKRLFKVAFKK